MKTTCADCYKPISDGEKVGVKIEGPTIMAVCVKCAKRRGIPARVMGKWRIRYEPSTPVKA